MKFRYKEIQKITLSTCLNSWTGVCSLMHHTKHAVGHGGEILRLLLHCRALFVRSYRKKLVGLSIGSIFFLWATGLFLVWETMTHGSDWISLLFLAVGKHGVVPEPYLPFASGLEPYGMHFMYLPHPGDCSSCLIFLLPYAFTDCPSVRILWEADSHTEFKGHDGYEAELRCSSSDSLSRLPGSSGARTAPQRSSELVLNGQVIVYLQ